MRIGHVVPTEVPVTHASGGALQRRVRELALVQSAAGHDVVIFSPRDTDTNLLAVAGPMIMPIPLRLDRPLADYEYLLRLASRARGLHLDVLHAHGAPEAARFLDGAARVNVQTVDFYRYRGTSHRVVKSHFENSLNKFDAVLPVSNYCAEGLTHYFPGLKNDVQVVPNGVNLRQFADEPARRHQARTRLGLPETRFCLYLGRVSEQKGSDMLPGLARRLKAAGLALVVAGPAERFGNEGGSPLVEEISESGAQYLGAVPEELLPGLLASAELLVLPTRSDEMFGMVLIEAGAAGTPAVASDQGGIPEAMGEAGSLFPVGDQSAFEELVLTTMFSPELLSDLGSRAVRNAARFNWSHVAEQYERVYSNHLLS